jgi:hypothetical protein
MSSFMPALRYLGIFLLLPGLCAAAEPNPFLSPDANKKVRPTPNPFVSPSHITKKGRIAKEIPLPPAAPSIALPPLPPPLPVSASNAPIELPPLDLPGHKERGAKACIIAGLPTIPNQAGAGGAYTIKIPELTSRCIAGIESGDAWLHIMFFNGRELHLQIDPNPDHGPRESKLLFASMTDSQQLAITQNGADPIVARRP